MKGEDITVEAVEQAIRESDELGREAFRDRYGFGPATKFELIHDGNRYDSKAIVGRAYGITHPDEGEAWVEGLSGGFNGGAAIILERKGFEISAVRDAADPRVWRVWAGENGQSERLDLDNDCVLIGWSRLGPLSNSITRDEIKRRITEVYGEQDPFSLGQQASMLFRFIHDVSVGDLVVVPLASTPEHVAIGRVTGEYEPRREPEYVDHDATNARPVEWLSRAAGYAEFGDELRSKFSLRGSLREISPPGAADELLRVAGAQVSHAWLFQANERFWDLPTALEVLPTVQWVVRQSKNEIRAGERVHLWQSGSDGGILARARTLTEPKVEPNDPASAILQRTSDLAAPELRVWMAVERVLDQPISRDEVKADPTLKDLGVLGFANATNFKMPADHDERLARLENERAGRNVEPEKLFFITASNVRAPAHYQTSLVHGIPLEALAPLVKILPQLEKHAVDGRVYASFARPGDRGEAKWERLNPGDVCLVYANGRFPLWGRVYAKARSADVARAVWGELNDEILECMYFLYPLEELNATREDVVDALGYSESFTPQDFEIPRDEVQAQLRDTHPTLAHLISQLKGDAAEARQRVWWVCQGNTYAKERDEGLMWAPKRGKNGVTRAFWSSLEDANPGDRVLHYAGGSVRAVGTVAARAQDAAKPAGLGGEWSDDGWLVRTDYLELAQPLALSEIPQQWRIDQGAPFTKDGSVQQGYFFGLDDEFVRKLAERFPQLGLNGVPPVMTTTLVSYAEPTLEEIVQRVRRRGMRIDDRTLRRYHVSLRTRKFVVLSGLSGSGKTWLAELYAEAMNAKLLSVAVAPNWTSNEDLLGYYDPLAQQYRYTPFSHFLEEAAHEWQTATRAGVTPTPYHLLLDEMNLARVEYYFAKFLSAMEVRSRDEEARLELDATHSTTLTPNLYFVGTVNIDETTHDFADKIYDRAQLLEIPVRKADIEAHLTSSPYRQELLDVWEALHEVAPFAYRVLDELHAYVTQAAPLGVPTEDALDEQLLQKVLPKIKGTDKALGAALRAFIDLAGERWPLSREKADRMLKAFETHGIASYFDF